MAELPLSYDLKILSNRTWVKTFRWLPAGVAADFTGWKARLQIRATVDSPDPPLVDLTTENGGIVLTNTGYINLAASISQTILLDEINRPRYDLVLRSPGGSVFTFLTGVVDVVPYVSAIPAV